MNRKGRIRANEVKSLEEKLGEKHEKLNRYLKSLKLPPKDFENYGKIIEKGISASPRPRESCRHGTWRSHGKPVPDALLSD